MNRNKRIPGIIALKQIIEATSAYTGKEFFKILVAQLAEILNVHGVWVTEYLPKQNTLNALAFWLNGRQVEHYKYVVTNTPCEKVLGCHDICHIPDKVIELYPKDPDLKPLGAVSYMGISLRDPGGKILGHLALLDNKPMPEIPEEFAIFKIFAERASAELQRERALLMLKENESKLDRLVNGLTDAVMEFGTDLRITQVNAAASNLFCLPKESFHDRSLQEFFDGASFTKISSHLPVLEGEGAEFTGTTISRPLICTPFQGKDFSAKVHLSSYFIEGARYYLLYIRNIEEALSDKRKIRQLHTETLLLREQVADSKFDYIIGESPAIKRCLEQVRQVAPTDANVLILGETGTGKELFAKAVHEASERSNKPMVTLNCAALSSDLIESELFGHVKGAFTGALQAREGRFSLADTGSIFLDEIAELPLALQAKLLRVIQEGTFEPVGSSETKVTDVRIIAATHRNLEMEVKEGRFREDLFYRLHVFPLHIPSLRERGDDIVLLATAFCQKFSKSRGLPVAPLTPEDLIALRTYPWPGNVRELQNIIERGVILSGGGALELRRILPMSPPQEVPGPDPLQIYTYSELRNLERENIIKALNASNWKLSGSGSASEILQIPRTTLTSKIKILGIKRMAV